MPHQLNNGTEGIWLFSRYSDVATILRETVSISKDKNRMLRTDQLSALDRMLLNMDPPGHTRLRADMEASIERVVQDLLTNIPPGGEVEFIGDFALKLPLLVIAGILGVPAKDMLQMKRWTDVLISGVDSGVSGENENSQAENMLALTDYLTHLIAKQKPCNDNLIGYLKL